MAVFENLKNALGISASLDQKYSDPNYADLEGLKQAVQAQQAQQKQQQSVIDPLVHQAAEQLGYAAGQSLNNIIQQQAQQDTSISRIAPGTVSIGASTISGTSSQYQTTVPITNTNTYPTWTQTYTVPQTTFTNQYGQYQQNYPPYQPAPDYAFQQYLIDQLKTITDALTSMQKRMGKLEEELIRVHSAKDPKMKSAHDIMVHMDEYLREHVSQ